MYIPQTGVLALFLRIVFGAVLGILCCHSPAIEFAVIVAVDYGKFIGQQQKQKQQQQHHQPERQQQSFYSH